MLEGTFHDSSGSFPVGTYVRNPIGSSHSPWVEADGCTIFVKLRHMDTSDKHCQQQTSFEQQPTCQAAVKLDVVHQLYENTTTGEKVHYIQLKPGSSLPISLQHEHGEEIFVIAGSVSVVGMHESVIADDENYSEECHSRWSWIRYPPGTYVTDSQKQKQKQSKIRAGASGCTFLYKSGHLKWAAQNLPQPKACE